jgi:PAS domain S-box-containing protein
MKKKDDRPEQTAPLSSPGQTLRRRAEEKARAEGAEGLGPLSPEVTQQMLHELRVHQIELEMQNEELRLAQNEAGNGYATATEATRRALYELRVHQIELEMQNEELRRTQGELDAARARYFDLYNLAPVGYITLSEHGLILEANLTAATLLGVPRGALVNQPISRFILQADQDTYYLRRKQLFDTGEPQTWELRMLYKGGTPFWAHLVATAAQDPAANSGRDVYGSSPAGASQGSPVLRVVMSDVTERKLAEETLQLRSAELRRLAETLERRVTERVEELATKNEALRHLSSQLLSAEEGERKRIAREIHDGLGASLAGAKFKMEDTLFHLGESDPRAVAAIESVIALIQETVREARRIQTALRPSMLDDLGLLATISSHCREFEETYPAIRVRPEIDLQEQEVPDPLKVVIFRVLQEAMNNAAKHSQADLVRLTLRKLHHRMELVIQDNGRGFNPGKVLSREGSERGMGLTSMRERVELSGGSHAIESPEGLGTTIRASWSLEGEGQSRGPIGGLEDC